MTKSKSQNITSSKNFAITGVAGYIAPRHLQAIKDTGNTLIAAVDPLDSVGVLDEYFPDAQFFTEFERFERFMDKLRREEDKKAIDYVSICSPNFLHDSHIRSALHNNAHAICEKPMVLNPQNFDSLIALEKESGKKVFTILQLRVHPALAALKKKIESQKKDKKHEIMLTYITPRGPWYLRSWKGDVERSGGIVTNIGIHLFDLLLWMFGSVQTSEVHHNEPNKICGFLELENARVQWFLSIDEADLPHRDEKAEQQSFRSMTVDGDEVEFSGGFADLHTRIYEKTFEGTGFGIEDARPSVSLVYDIRNLKPVGINSNAHPLAANIK